MGPGVRPPSGTSCRSPQYQWSRWTAHLTDTQTAGPTAAVRTQACFAWGWWALRDRRHWEQEMQSQEGGDCREVQASPRAGLAGHANLQHNQGRHSVKQAPMAIIPGLLGTGWSLRCGRDLGADHLLLLLGPAPGSTPASRRSEKAVSAG